MSVQPFPNAKFRAFDTNGDPLSGGLLYTYSAGTTTPISTYTTRAGTTPNSNPVVLDANGEADVWTTPGVDYKFELRNSSGVLQWTVDNIPSPDDTSTTQVDAVSVDPGGRLSLTSLTPVTTSDVTGATTIYYVPHRHNRIALWNGQDWVPQAINSQLSQATTDNTKSPAAVANNSNYDLFVWLDFGTLRLSRGPAWTSDTARGTGAGTTELTQIGGRYVNAATITNGPSAEAGLYVGTVRSDGSAQINDSLLKRHVWNMYHRASRAMRATESANSWVYNTATWRQANGSTANQLDLVLGLNEDTVSARVLSCGVFSFPEYGQVGVGLDATNALASGCINQHVGPQTVDMRLGMTAEWRGHPGIGRHYLAWLEYCSAGGGGILWLGDNNTPTVTQSGISGEVLA
jgi:hypothetical protein